MTDKHESESWPDLVERAQEMGQVEAMLSSRNPALVVVSGKAGMGKTTLLRQIKDHAKVQGWKVLFCGDAADLCVGADTTIDGFQERVLATIGVTISENESFIDQEREFHTTAELRQHQTEPEDTEDKTSQLGIWSERLFGRKSRAPRHFRSPLVKQLFHLVLYKPVILVVDGYRPGATFARWFENSFVADIRNSDFPIVVIVAAHPLYADRISPSADEVVALGPLEPTAVRKHFMSISERITPLMSKAELDKYVEAATENPELLGDLTRVLRLAQSGEQ